MNKPRHPVDEFFSEVLKNYKVTPTEAARNAFLKDAEGIERTAPGYKSRKKWVLLALSGILLLTCITGIFFTNRHNTGITTPLLKNKTLSNNKRDDPAIGKNSAGLESGQSKVNTPREHARSISIERSTGRQESLTISHPVQSSIKDISGSSSTSTFIEDDLIPRTVIRRMDPIYLDWIDIKNTLLFAVSEGKKLNLDSIIDHSDSIMNNEEQIPIHKEDESSNPRNRLFSAGLYYSPEWMFNILEANKNMRADNLGLEGTFHFGPYSVGTGVGISISKGTNEIVIGYNDYLGTYKGLDSIVFKWDASHTHLFPVYYYTDKVVYDTLLKLDYSYYEKRYIYLQIPIKLGYDFIRNKIFTLGVRVGPTLSILLQSSAKSASYDLGKDRIVQLNNVTPDRVQTNWQISAGINAGIRLTRRFGLEVEPDIRYYFNSVYEKPDNDKKPWSVGFRVALLLNK